VAGGFHSGNVWNCWRRGPQLPDPVSIAPPYSVFCKLLSPHTHVDTNPGFQGTEDGAALRAVQAGLGWEVRRQARSLLSIAGTTIELYSCIDCTATSVDPRGRRCWAGTKTPPFGGVRSIYLDTENIQNQTPARICMHRKVSFFRSMKLTRNRSFILLKIQRQFLRVFACNQQKFILTQNHVHDAVPAQRPSDRETGRLR